LSANFFALKRQVKVAKNKVAPPFRIGEFDILFGQGISTMGCLLDLAEQEGIVIRKGAWYSYDGDNIGQGRDNTVQRLLEDPEFAAKVEAQVKEKLSIGGYKGETAAGEDEDDFDIEDTATEEE
jgi:recombination protein RecA